MLESIIESMGMTGYSQRKNVIHGATPAATSAAYTRALERATAATKADIAYFYPQNDIRRGNQKKMEIIDVTQPHHRHSDGFEFDDTRDQSIENTDERLTTGVDRDGVPAYTPPNSFKLASERTVHTISMDRISSPEKLNVEQEDESEIYNQNIEAKNLLESILQLDTDVTEAAATVYQYIENNKIEKELSPTGRAIEVIHSIKEELWKGNSKPAYQFLETAKSVLPVLLEERQEAGIQLEAKIFSKDSDDSVISSESGESNKDVYSHHNDMRSISEQTAAIFQFLDDTKPTGTMEKGRRSEDPAGTKPYSSGESHSNIFRILEENEKTPDGIYGDPFDSDDPTHFSAPSVDDMDLEFVENFDLAYSEFLFYHPKLVAKKSNLMKKLRVYKLQKLLEYNEILERTNTGKLLAMVEEKREIEESMHLKLKEAVRKKAAHQTYLQSEVNDVNWNTKQIQAKLRWKVLRYSEDRLKRQLKLRLQFKQIPLAKTRQDFIRLIPEGPHSEKLKTAIKASFIAEGGSNFDVLSSKQEDQLRKFQSENAIFNSEICVLIKKNNHLREEAKKFEWVSKTLSEFDPVTLHNFKRRVEEHEGVKL
eukprot:CAMPEP_0197179076 /NCGR_PEP_ID=MMETSP1423-20130617/4145_1 /TAXON_ID=476441 /ORGANISM="Pseudo-nitzschia heimii, Strain UNC1101" /LENGTH=594 /DNA_ID=CAMNT_0042628931 /DNA_START=48 /DNA_END=1832 /DNA_ORIENTATION=+